MRKPKPTAGLHHIALFVKNFEACKHFYTALLGMRVIWQPDDDNVYLTSGSDNLALHRAKENFAPLGPQRLDHIGYFLREPEDVDQWHAYFETHKVPIQTPPKDHRDGTRSFYCEDPDGNLIQMIYYPLVG